MNLIAELVFNINDIKIIAESLIKYASGRKKWCFYGDLGSGKTTLIKAVCRYLGVKGTISSPTFSLVNEYSYFDKRQEKLKSIYHLDLYRLKIMEEALDIGIEEYLYNEDYCFIEWAEIIAPILPEEILRVEISMTENSSTRKIKIESEGNLV